MKLRILSAAFIVGTVIFSCNKSPNQPTGDYRLVVTLLAQQDSLTLFTNYIFSYQTGTDAFDSISAHTVPAGFLNPAASVTWNHSAKTGTVYFIRTGQCCLCLSGRTSDNRTFTDSCLVTVRSPLVIAGDSVIDIKDTAALFLAAPRPFLSMISGIKVQWKINNVPMDVLALSDTLYFSNVITATYSVVATLTDTVHGDAAPIDTFALKIGDYRLTATWPAHPDSLALFTNYSFSYQTGTNPFDSLYAYTSPAGFINPSASLTLNLVAKTGTAYFIKTGQCRLYLAGRAPGGEIFLDSCLVTVRNSYDITGDTLADRNDTAKLYLVPRPDPASMASGTKVEWKVNGASTITEVNDTFRFSNSVSGSYSIIASFVDTARGDTAALDTLPLQIGDYRLTATWPAHPNSLALFTNYAFSYVTGTDAFDSLYAYTSPAGFINPDASVSWNLVAKTGTVYFIRTGQCRLYLAGRAPNGSIYTDSCLVTVRNSYSIAGDTLVDRNESADIFLAPRPDPASMASGTKVEWKVNSASAITAVDDTFRFSNSDSGNYSIIASFVDTTRGDSAAIDTLLLRIGDYRLTVTWPLNPDSLALFTNHAFSYLTGSDAFDSMYAYTSPAGFINSAASVAWNLAAKTGTVYFIRTGQCRLYLEGRTPSGRLFTDSCPVTVRNPYGITGDTAVDVGQTAQFFIVPQPLPAAMAAGTKVAWRVDGVSEILDVDDTFDFPTVVSGTYPVIASFVDSTRGDSAAIDTLSLEIGDYRLTATWPTQPDSLVLFTNNAFSYVTGTDAFDSMYAYTSPTGFINPSTSVAWNLAAKTGTIYFIKTGQCRLYLAGRASGGSIFTDSCLVIVRNPYVITGDTAVDAGQTARFFIIPRPSAAPMAPGTMVAWNANGVTGILCITDTFDFSSAVSGTYPVIASLVDTAHRDTAALDTFTVKVKDYRMAVTWPARPDSLVLFTNYTFPYQTGADAFDSLYVGTDSTGFLNATASVIWNMPGKTATVYFIRTGRCRFFMAGRVPDGRRFADSCLITVRNPYSIAGDTAVGRNEPAKLALAPRPVPASMAPGVMADWTVNGITSTIIGVADTFSYSNIMTGSYSITVALVDTAHRDTARLDSLSLRVLCRIKTVAFGNGSGTISPANPLVTPGGNQAFTITPAAGSVVAKLYKGTSALTALSAYTWTNVTASDSLRVMFYAVPAQSKPIPAQGNSFTMGTNNTAFSGLNFGPAHTVTLTYNYYLDTTEVRQDDYFSLMGVAPSSFTGIQTRPVENLTWFDAVLYCNARSKRDGLDTVYSYTSVTGTRGNGTSALGGLAIDLTKIGYRLPSEAECEYALRAGSTTEFYWGRGYPVATLADTLALDSNVVWQHNSSASTQPVASKKPNAWGLYDLIGNVEEWCNDWYGTFTSTPVTDPTGPAGPATYRSQRGGAWSQAGGQGQNFVSAGRWYQLPNARTNTMGFRALLPAAR